jgi:hypothetical protein
MSHPGNQQDYNDALDVGDVYSMVAGLFESDFGATTATAATVTTVGSGGATAIVSVPTAVGGAIATWHGAFTMNNAIRNFGKHPSTGNGRFNGKNDTESKTSKESFRKAKDQNGIPRSQQPDKTYKVDEVSKGQKTGKKLTEHEYTNSEGKKVRIRKDNPTQYNEGGKGDQGPHYNAGEGDKLKQHHNYEHE